MPKAFSKKPKEQAATAPATFFDVSPQAEETKPATARKTRGKGKESNAVAADPVNDGAVDTVTFDEPIQQAVSAPPGSTRDTKGFFDKPQAIARQRSTAIGKGHLARARGIGTAWMNGFGNNRETLELSTHRSAFTEQFDETESRAEAEERERATMKQSNDMSLLHRMLSFVLPVNRK
ncbi:hypothetical protein [Paraburkholderia hospita]|uniref:Uncharacterized protein n=1 Tax=Paraburkholderia hospita TaxID=169430 RepID=A0AAN1JHQ3_9BURK|nr:hypothetical protein [Paraburkholderia hospita]AUT74041.1 hypothetical protein C2L64_37730 [Paraburkholderia hospita]EIN02951.1 hypothetical protein WQE_00975 [Paraburkholderia hospita]OUL78689.1 hypothetical protein CA602_31085 [Paraburkholderia hospita]OUL85894.1 hypothetical protein CA601_23080 [Paraburkholderia hospita]SEH45487.1 hypothetical protein SAMN05192544_100244 [Paraburkholderia hospita]